MRNVDSSQIYATLAIAITSIACAALVPEMFEDSPAVSPTNVNLVNPKDLHCESMSAEAAELLPQADSCRDDAECFHSQCTCSALARGEASDKYLQLQRSLERECDGPRVQGYCGQTFPVCRNGSCTV